MSLPTLTMWNLFGPCNLCPHMKRNTLANIHQALETLEPRVEIDPDVAVRARRSVERMLALGR